MEKVVFIVFLTFFSLVQGHGYLSEPSGRSSMWRAGFTNVPINYDDNALNCGGFDNQWNVNSGKCGFCGDPFQANPKPNELGGIYATGTIARTYQTSIPNNLVYINATVVITANHLGYIEFRLCDNPILTQECFDKNLLKFDTGLTRRQVLSTETTIRVRLLIPLNLTCSNCVLQWQYWAGNSWGVDPVTGQGCVGCGPQETFWACSDIAILDFTGNISPTNTNPPSPTSTQTPTTSSPQPTNPPLTIIIPTLSPLTTNPTTQNPTTQTPIQTTTRTPSTTVAPTAAPSGVNRNFTTCRAIGPWTSDAFMNTWCQANCALNNCPSDRCLCSVITCSCPS